MPRLPLSRDDYLDVLFRAQLLCDVCEERSWQTHARWHAALICDGCAEGEPEPEEDSA
jgi:hypothetical protein